MRPTSLDRFRVTSPRPAYEANANGNVNEGVFKIKFGVVKSFNRILTRNISF